MLTAIIWLVIAIACTFVIAFMAIRRTTRKANSTQPKATVWPWNRFVVNGETLSLFDSSGSLLGASQPDRKSETFKTSLLFDESYFCITASDRSVFIDSFRRKDGHDYATGSGSRIDATKHGLSSLPDTAQRMALPKPVADYVEQELRALMDQGSFF